MSRDSQDVNNNLNPSSLLPTTPARSVDSTASVKKGFIFALLITISLGTFQFGYSIGVFNTLQAPLGAKFEWTQYAFNSSSGNWTIDKDTSTTSTWSTIITTVCSIGAAIGAISSGTLAKYGKWRCIVFNNILVCIGAAITLAPNEYVMTVGRFIYGLSNGAFSVFVPLYINETAPVELKGPLGVMTQLFVTVGIMVSFLIGLVVPQDPCTVNPGGCTPDQYNNDYTNWVHSWQVQYYYMFMFGLPILISVIQVLLLLTVFNYETPKVMKQRNQIAKLNVLLGKIYDASRVQEKIDGIIIDQAIVGQTDTQVTYGKTMCHPMYKTATLVGVTMSIFQQLSGINAVMFYSSTIFATIPNFKATTGTALVGVVNMVATLASTFLLAFFGRKTLLWTLSFLMAADLVGLGIAMITEVAALEVTLILVFVILFEFSIGPILWIYMSETMTDKGVSLGTLANWIFTIIMALITPTLIDAIGGSLFIIFGGFCFACGLFSLFIVKETKGLTNAEVAALYSKGKTYLNFKEQPEDETNHND